MDKHTTFEERRRFLFGLSYRLLGSRAEAEDVVQDVYVKWFEADTHPIDNPAAWLTRVCTRHCIDQLRAARRQRVEYVGTWLPEPLHMIDESTPESSLELASSLSTAFLLLLDRLAPRERAAYLLKEIFDMDYSEVAAALGVQEATCRKLVSRARAGIGSKRGRNAPPRERQEALLSAFHTAIFHGAVAPLATLLVEDVELAADGGGKVSAIREPVRGKTAVLAFMSTALREYWRDYQWEVADLNGARGVVLRSSGTVVAAMSVSWTDEGCVEGFYIMRNPDKLIRIQE